MQTDPLGADNDAVRLDAAGAQELAALISRRLIQLEGALMSVPALAAQDALEPAQGAECGISAMASGFCSETARQQLLEAS